MHSQKWAVAAAAREIGARASASVECRVNRRFTSLALNLFPSQRRARLSIPRLRGGGRYSAAVQIFAVLGSAASIVALALFLAITPDGQAAAKWAYPEALLATVTFAAGALAGLLLHQRRRAHAHQDDTPSSADGGSVGPSTEHGSTDSALAFDGTRLWVSASMDDFASRSAGTWLLVPGQPLQGIERLLRSAWDTLERDFGDERADDDSRLEFRITFMTRSYRDDAITVAAWANRGNRRPRSLQQRDEDTTIYENTVTADIYRMRDPAAVISSDTTAPRHSARFRLYADERRIIRSHMAWPVLSPDSGLLGTFVVDCNRRGFFRQNDRSAWQAFCEPILEIIALEKLRLDRAFLPTSTGLEGPGPERWSTPPA